ncbi:MAG TPA: DUF3298 and DUF4163 domain-containing protein [Flavobacteriaceae bacterium]|nr:DUF3298 and DUF4163 domain-containing protein [Flavobacteriaceae bacterium]MCB9212121.1 DUF3298 and DUF4163 domain-containing protein [Alteromonas sp.]HPF10499.1 DUF3298 and DUF4163 domain-containing protein [Flavobacteriaceae bacterium]HQU22104.1 DUF3298 and DUF4163 domain-containing protein [Flavobacteriaceae bacterium]HQU66097.1 DUF3298 and DUF4163 domain-containing protein [Flavobacteriaceae bacterium]
MRRFAYLLLMLFLTGGCKKDTSITAVQRSFSETDLGICQNAPCSQVSIIYPEYSGKDPIINSINKQIESSIIAALFLGEDAAPAANSIEAAAKQFILAYRDLKNEFEFEAPYEANIEVVESFRNAQLLSLEMDTYLFTGGAHGYASTQFLNHDLKTGRELTLKELVKKYPDFESFAEKTFREQFHIPSGDNINSTGFWFENDQFYLPNSFGFTEEGFVVVYNPYDIASFADGSIELTIPFDQVRPYLTLPMP